MSFLSHRLTRLDAQRFVASVAALAILSTCGISQAAIWDGGGADNEYSTALNWDDDMVPDGAANSTQDINSAVTVDRNISSTSGRTFLKGGAILNIASGVHNDQRSGANIFNFVGDNGAGTVNQSGGDYDVGHGLRVGVGSNPDGTYNLTGGDLTIYRGSNSKSYPTNPGGRPSMEVGDAAGSGVFNISGGTFETRASVHIGATGEFNVMGSTASVIGIGSNGSVDGLWLQKPGGAITSELDAGGLTPIFVDDVGTGTVFDPAGTASGLTTCTTCAALFESGSVLNASFGTGVTHVPGTWTVMEVEGRDIDDQGIVLNAASGWSYDVDNSGPNGLLTITYTVPEPTSLALLALSVAGLLFVRRKK